MSTPVDVALATPKRLVDPTPAQVDEAVEVLLKAFKDDHLMPIVVANDHDLARLQFKASIGSALVGGGLVHVLVVPSTTTISSSPDGSGKEEGTERIIGVAIWYPTNTNPNATPEQRAAGWDAFVASAEEKNPELKAWWTDYYRPLVQAAHASLVPTNFVNDSWNLLVFGVLPEYQGKGLGKKLYKLAEVQAEAAKAPIFLQTGTDLDVLIYQRLGLSVVGDFTMESKYGNAKMTVMVKKWE